MNEERCLLRTKLCMHSLLGASFDYTSQVGWMLSTRLLFFTKILLRSRVEFSRVVGMIFRFLGLRMIFNFLVFKKRKTRSSLLGRIHAQRRNEVQKETIITYSCILASIRISRIPTYTTAENSTGYYFTYGWRKTSFCVVVVLGRCSAYSRQVFSGLQSQMEMVFFIRLVAAQETPRPSTV